MSRIVMVLSNPFRPDRRVDQEAMTLTAHGHQVTVICWDRHGELTGQETRHGIRIIRIQNRQGRLWHRGKGEVARDARLVGGIAY